MKRSPLAAFAALLLVLGSSAPVLASTPASHDVTVPTADGQVVTVEWTGTVAPGSTGANNTCPTTGQSSPLEDGHVINLTVPAGTYSTVNVTADFHIEWDDDGASDLVLTVEKNGAHVSDSDGGSPEENITVANPSAATYEAVACAFAAPLPVNIRGRLRLTATAKAPPPTANGDTDGDGVTNEFDLCPGTAAGTPVDVDGCPAPTAAGLAPRFQVHVSPEALGNDAGEPSIGFNKFTGRTMFIAYTSALRETYQEEIDPPLLPASCPALWEDKSGTLTTVNSLDPILYTDEATGRTFNSQLSGDNSLMEYTDDDGESWTPAQVGPPNGGADHQTVATGVYPAGSAFANTATWPSTGPKRAVYYCSQSVATAFCSRSDNGGVTFGNGNNFKNTDCAAGALHGHVKVAPDGTVYVPDSSQCVAAIGGTADHIIAFRSDDAGVTWSVKDVPGSVGSPPGGSDPSIGISTDGTLFMCYENGDSHVHMVVSHDKGDTWINDRDLGAAQGIVQTRFPQAISGDNDRAACAFLGTATPGNGNSLDFQGVWYGYIATTYDGGDTYHLVNVTGTDPVQGYGGICGGGTCRNLLDFNDLQIDDQGRLLFGFADGCTKGCVKDPSANSFAAKATVVRQTGGRTMFAALDNQPSTRYNNPTPIEPAAACARQDLSSRSVLQANVVWNAPDTGGSRITNYKVYRAIDQNGPFTAIGDAGRRQSFVDTTTNPSVPKYYYRVEASNAIGLAPVSNTIELPISTEPVDTCIVPGEPVALDATGDATPPADDMDIAFVAVAEPAAYPDDFVVTMKVVNFTSGQPPASSFYPILFPSKGDLYIAMDLTAGPVKYAYGTYADVGQGVLQFTQAGLLDTGSGFTADGTITLVVPRSVFGDPAIDSVIAGFDARTRAGSQSATSRDTAGPSDYTVRGAQKCIDAVVLASLKVSLNQGNAPLDVNFTLTGQPPSGATLKGYTLDFGDGTAAATGTFDGNSFVQVPHRYAAPGVFRAKLSVTDSTDRASTNLAEETITALGGKGGLATNGNNRLGGAMPGGLLLVGLLALTGRRRRKR